jgi:hypothetical protein
LGEYPALSNVNGTANQSSNFRIFEASSGNIEVYLQEGLSHVHPFPLKFAFELLAGLQFDSQERIQAVVAVLHEDNLVGNCERQRPTLRY